MGVAIKKENRIRKVAEQRRANIRKLPGAHMAKNGGKNYAKDVKDRKFKNGASREVMVKITGSGRTPRGVKNEINYIGRDGEVKIFDSEGNEYSLKEKTDRKEAYDFMIDFEDKLTHKDETAPKLVHNMMFSAPNIAGVSEEDAMKVVAETLREKYPNNRFMLAYHKDTDSHHVHALLRIPDNKGKRIDIKKKDLRELREKFAGKLQTLGYNVTCTHKYQMGLKDKLKREPDRLRGLYEVIDFGRGPYRDNPKAKDNNFITLRTLKNNTPVKFWGTNLADEIAREQVQKGSIIKIKKEGATNVKVPKLDKQGNQIGWTETHRNNWRIENFGRTGIKKPAFPKEIRLDSPEQLLKQKRNLTLFKQSQAAMLKLQQNIKLGIKGGRKF
ncbi:relaxase/mobilization nuclease [Salmonella enterica]|nr:relaxase/mobilization nuclease [Salmonella enterica]